MAAPMSLCRLCITTCNDDFKSLYDENGQANGLYELTYDYFHPKIVDLEKAKHLTAICLECFRHIHDFHSFQTSVTIAQLELIAEDKTIYITAEETETPQCENITQAMAIKVEEEEFIGFTPAYAVEKDCQQIMQKEFITLSDIQIDDSLASTIMNNHQIIETLSIKGGANDEEDRKDHISLPPLEIMDVHTGSTFTSDDEGAPLEIMDVHTGSTFTSDDEIPLAQLDVINSSATKSRSFDGGVTEKFDNPKSSDTQPQKKYETLKNLLAKWIPNIKCFICSKSFPSWPFLKMHFKQQHPDQKFYYMCCSRKFTRHFIKDHLRLHSDPDAFKCSLCGKRYNANISLGYHYNDKHSEILKFPCKKCKKRFVSNHALTSHQRLMHKSKRQYRRALQKDKTPKLSSKQDLSCRNANVQEDREDNSISPFPLEIMNVDTGGVFNSGAETPLGQIHDRNASLSKMTDDQKSSHDQQQKNQETLENLLAKWLPKIKCFKCSKSFPSWSLVKVHFKRQHPNERFYYKCCSRKLRQNVIKDHLILHSDPDAFKCSICGKRYNSSIILSGHNSEMHTESFEFSCDKCGKRFRSKIGLRNHQSKIHNSNRPDHAKIEPLADGRFAYNCQLCGETKYSRTEFRMHKSKIHGFTTSKVVCTICGKGCMSERTFREHMASHEKKEIYKCAFCPEKFKTIAAVKIHRQRLHPLKSGKNYYIYIGESESKKNPTNRKSSLAKLTEQEDCGEDIIAATADQQINENKVKSRTRARSDISLRAKSAK